MMIDDRLKVVKLAEIECEKHSDNARHAWKQLKGTMREAATPWRIVVVGAVSGYLMGRSGGGAAGGDSVGAKLFGTVAQALITTFGASATAGMAATSAADAAASATAGAVAEGSSTPESRIAAAKEKNEPTAVDG
jgi:TctA family transporter